jgi:hypothetical protein
VKGSEFIVILAAFTLWYRFAGLILSVERKEMVIGINGNLFALWVPLICHQEREIFKYYLHGGLGFGG